MPDRVPCAFRSSNTCQKLTNGTVPRILFAPDPLSRRITSLPNDVRERRGEERRGEKRRLSTNNATSFLLPSLVNSTFKVYKVSHRGSISSRDEKRELSSPVKRRYAIRIEGNIANDKTDGNANEALDRYTRRRVLDVRRAKASGKVKRLDVVWKTSTEILGRA